MNFAPALLVNGPFGTDVVIDGVSGRAIFDEAYAEAFEVAGSAPRLTYRVADFPSVARGQSVTIGARSFKTAAVPEPDGTGMAVVRLHQA